MKDSVFGVIIFIVVIMALCTLFVFALVNHSPAVGGEASTENVTLDNAEDYYNYTQNRTDNTTIPWKNVQEIREWVKETGVPYLPYVDDILDCDDKAYLLLDIAIWDNREMWIYIKKVYRDGKMTNFHMMNATRIGNRIYQIDAEYGRVSPLDGGAKID